MVNKKSQKKSTLESEKKKKLKEKIELRIADEIIRKSQETKKRRRSVFEAAENDSSTSLPEMTQSKRPRREAKVSKKYAEYEELDSSSSEKEADTSMVHKKSRKMSLSGEDLTKKKKNDENIKPIKDRKVESEEIVTIENKNESSNDAPLGLTKDQKKGSLGSEKQKKVKQNIETIETDESILKSQVDVGVKKRRRSVFEAAEDDSSTSLPETAQNKRPRREVKVSKKYAEFEELDSSSSEKEAVINLRYLLLSIFRGPVLLGNN